MKKFCLVFLLVLQLTFSKIVAADSFVINDIRFQGLQRISKDAVLYSLSVQKGQSFNTANSANLIRSIFKTGFFKDVVLEMEANVLIIKVVERPTIAKLDLLGIKSKDQVEKILKEANLYEGRVYDPAILAKVEQEIEHYYLSKGNYSIKVQSTVTEEKRNRVSISISIYTGDEAKIKKISITGNVAFDEKILLKQLLHARSNWLSWFYKDDRYAKEKHVAELELLKSFYLDCGYVNFQVDSSQVSLSPNKKDVYITINVTEGEQYYFGKVDLAGKFVVAKETLQQLIKQKIKDEMIFSRKILLDVQKDLEDCLGDHGYGNAEVRLNIENDDKARKINIEFFAVPGPRINVRRINIVGNRLTQDVVLRHGVEQMEGSWLSRKHVQEGKEEMLRRGYAGNVEVKNEPILGTEDQIDLLYKVEEQRTAQFSGGIAYSASEKLMFQLAADFRNFLGTGKDVNFSFDKGKVSETYSFGYFNPFFTSDGVGMGYNLYKQKVNVSKTSHIFDYGVNSIGGDVNWAFPLSRNNSFIVGVGADKSDLIADEDAPSAPNEAKAFIKKKGKKFTEYTGSIGWRHNSLDQFIFPTKGNHQKIVFRTTLPSSTLKYYSVQYDTSWFYPLTDKYVVNLSSEMGYKASYKRKEYFPFFKHFYAGGAESIRGFGEKSLGSLDSKGEPFGGNLLVVGKASFIFSPPFYPDAKSVRTALFLDAGQVYDTNYRYSYNPNTGDQLDKKSRNPHGLRYSVGVSLTWHSPLGVPILISIANPINAKKSDHKHRFSFSFGTQFF